MADQTDSNLIYFNGINGATGAYTDDPMPLEEFVRTVAERHGWSPQHWNDIQQREFLKQPDFGVLAEHGDGSDIRLVGWGLVFPASAEGAQVDAILQALDPLVRLREEQMGRPAKIYRENDGLRWWQPTGEDRLRPETKNEWLARHGAGPGQVDPTIVPYYLLIVGDPLSIPFPFQYELDVQYAVGRIYFTSLADYARYAASVVEAESGRVRLPRKAVFFGVANKDDRATGLAAEHLVKPLSAYVTDRSRKFNLGWESALVEPEAADRQTLKSLLGGAQTPALLFTASHGIDFPYRHPDQLRYQGAIVCRDWKGPLTEKATRQHYLAAEDIPDDHNLLGSIVFHFACFGGGTPYWDEYAIARNKDQKRLAHRPFLSALPTRLLAHPNGGALAVLAHIDRAWTYSFKWGQIEEQNTAFQGILFQLMNGRQVGLALESMNDRYSEIATMLSNSLQDLKFTQQPSMNLLARVAFEYTANNDSRGYAILGDPAVRLPLAAPGDAQVERPVIQLAAPVPGVLPVVLDPQASNALDEEERQVIEAENQSLRTGAPVNIAPPTGPAPVLRIARDGQASAGGGTGTGGTLSGGVTPPASGARPFSTPIDGLAFALQAYTTDETVSFSLEGGVSFNVLDDARDKIKEVVVNLNTALANLAKKMREVTDELATLSVTTGVVDSLESFDPKTGEKRILTRVTASGDIEVFVPRDAGPLDEDLLELHQQMVRQALSNRLEVAKALAETVASLCGKE